MWRICVCLGGGEFLYPFHRTPLSLNSAEMKGKMEGKKKMKIFGKLKTTSAQHC